jgi:hypothetical protein
MFCLDVLLAVGVERVINGQLSFQQFLIVLIDESNPRQSPRDSSVKSFACIGSSDDERKSLERSISQIVFFDYGVEAALRTVMA